MTLASLIKDLKQTAKDEKSFNEKRSQLMDKIIIPEDFGRREINFQNLRKNKGNLPLYHLSISTFLNRSLENMQPLLNEFFSQAKELKFKKGIANIEYKIFWTPEDFQEENRLPPFFSSEVEITGYTFSINPTKIRIDHQGDAHTINTAIKANKMILNAKGNYRQHLENLIETFDFQLAKLRLSKEDAKRVLRKVKTMPLAKYLSPYFEKTFQSEERKLLSLGTSITIDSEEVIEIFLRTDQLPFIREILQKSLLNSSSKSETGVTELIKSYHTIDLLKNKRLSDLQHLARTIPEMNLGLVYGTPIITLTEAKELLDSEIQTISKYCKSRGHYPWLLDSVKRIAREQYEKEVGNKFDRLNILDYINFLKSKGYQPEKSLIVKLEEIEREEIKNKAQSRPHVREYYEHQKRKLKQEHLLAFFKQGYEHNPETAIKNFRDWYTNNKPELEISATVKDLDAAKLKKLKLPSKSRLFSFGIEEYFGKATPYSNDLVLKRNSLSDNVRLWSRTSIDSPTLLSLQEDICKELGIRFS